MSPKTPSIGLFPLGNGENKQYKVSLRRLNRYLSDKCHCRVRLFREGYPFNAGQLEDGHRDLKCRKAHPQRLRIQKPEALCYRVSRLKWIPHYRGLRSTEIPLPESPCPSTLKRESALSAAKNSSSVKA